MPPAKYIQMSMQSVTVLVLLRVSQGSNINYLKKYFDERFNFNSFICNFQIRLEILLLCTIPNLELPSRSGTVKVHWLRGTMLFSILEEVQAIYGISFSCYIQIICKQFQSLSNLTMALSHPFKEAQMAPKIKFSQWV